MSVAFATRTEFGDPAFVSNAKRWEEVTTKQYGREVLAKINDVRMASMPGHR